MGDQSLALVYNDPSRYQLAAPESSVPVPTASSSNALTIPAASRPASDPKTGLKNVPAFLNKLYSMVNDPSTDKLIRWTDGGSSFIVPAHEKLGKELLPRFFKHSNFGSFVRQLNMYGFHKVPHLQQGVLKPMDEDEKERSEILEFQNEHFHRDSPDLLYLIQRKKGLSTATAQGTLAGRPDSEDPEGANVRIPGTTSQGNGAAKLQADLSYILSEVQAIKRHQSILSGDLRELQTTNRSLWQENLEQRAKHDKNAETIDKILKFLAGVFGGRALSEGASFMSGHNIAAADSSSGLGLGSYGQGRSNANVKSSENTSAQAEQSYNDMELVPATKRRRLLLQDSPTKQSATVTQPGSAQTTDHPISQFEEIESDEDIPVLSRQRKTRSNSAKGSSSSGTSPQDMNASRFTDIKSVSAEPPNESRPVGTAETGQPPTADLDINSLMNSNDVDWASINAILNNGNPSNLSNNNPSQPSNSNVDYSNTDFSNFDFADTNLFPSLGNMYSSNEPNKAGSEGILAKYSPTLPGAGLPAQTQDPSSYPLALPPSNATRPTAAATTQVPQTQALTKYGDALTHVSDENAKIKERMDSLSASIDRLVAQLPSGFNFQNYNVGTSNGVPQAMPIQNNYDDEFDFSQYLDNPHLDMDSLSNSDQSQQGQAGQSGAVPSSLAASTSNIAGSSNSSNFAGQPNGIAHGGLFGAPPLGDETQSQQLDGQPSRGLPSSSLDIENAVKAEPAESPPSQATAAPLASTHTNQLAGKAPVKSRKQPAKTPGRGGKRRLSTASTVEHDPGSTQRRSNRQKSKA